MRFLFPILAAFGLLLAPAIAAEGIEFDQAYQPGHTYHQVMTMKQEMQMDMGEVKMDRKVSTTMGMQAVVTPHEDGRSKRVAIKYDSIQASIEGGGEKYAFDSKAPAEEAKAGPLKAYGKIVGQEFKVIFDRQENVTDVEQLDATIQNLAGNDPASAQIYQQLFNRDAVKRMMQQSALRSPIGTPIKKGGSWPFVQELDLPGLGKLTIRGFYTYKGDVEREGVKCAEVTASAEITMDTRRQEAAGDEAAQRLQQMQLKIEEGKMDGTLYYDTAIDFTRQIDVAHQITLTGKIPDGSGKGLRLPMKQTISMKLDQFGKTK
jgi:hypothetical protein